MDSDLLKNIQAPLKAKYKDRPEAAVVTLKAEGELGAENLSCSVETGRALVEAAPWGARFQSAFHASYCTSRPFACWCSVDPQVRGKSAGLVPNLWDLTPLLELSDKKEDCPQGGVPRVLGL